jgi:hypothetical protein
LLLVPFVVVPVALRASDGKVVRAVVATSLAVVAALTVVGPWVVRNAIRLDEPTIATVSSSTAIAGANCPQTYQGDALGSWSFACIHDELRRTLLETKWSARVRRDGANYAADHASRLPIVAGARAARLWSVWDPRDQVDRESLETRSRTWQYLVAWTGAITLALGIWGLVILGRRRRPIGGLVGIAVMATVVAVLTYGNTRFRATAEPALLIGVATLIQLAAHPPTAGAGTRREMPSRGPADRPLGTV